jgi:hypothetical protein
MIQNSEKLVDVEKPLGYKLNNAMIIISTLRLYNLYNKD